MDAYDICINLGKKNLANIVAIYVRGRELFRPPAISVDVMLTLTLGLV
jgi:hypothetical protein